MKKRKKCAKRKLSYNNGTIQWRNGYCEGLKVGYHFGEIERKKIDIEKAWKWVEDACSKHPITADELSILKQSFIHTMEE